MSKLKLEHLLVVLPGICGSSLFDARGKPVWDSTLRFAWRATSSFGGVIHSLALSDEDSDEGVHARDLILDATIVPGLVKIDGYSKLLVALRESFDDVYECGPDDSGPCNFVRFPYDWRLDNRVAAHSLKEVVTARLDQWRQFTDNPDAGVILIGHSMGGLISRYFLEVLGGHSDCVGLITLGTPYRGSLNALGFLANGYRGVTYDFTQTLRSFPSVYQLLPTYKAVMADGEAVRVCDFLAKDGRSLPFEEDQVVDSINFHREIENARRQRVANQTEYPTIAVAGSTQPTNQSAYWDGRNLQLKRELPVAQLERRASGDGTVPVFSAIPPEQLTDFHGFFVSERHASLQANDFVLENIIERIRYWHERDQLQEIAGKSDAQRAPIGVEVDDVYNLGNPVVVAVHTEAEEIVGGSLDMVVTRLSDNLSSRLSVEISAQDGSWLADLAAYCATEGIYRVSVEESADGPEVSPVSDIFAVVQ